MVSPFRLDVPQADLDDLRRRLRNTRWPDRETVDDWSQGISLDDRAEFPRTGTGYSRQQLRAFLRTIRPA
jgi:hypothetical protein